MIASRRLLLAVCAALVALVCGWVPTYWGQQAMKYQLDMQRNDPINAVEWAYSPVAHDYYRGYTYLPPGGLDDVYKRPTDAELHHRQNITEQLNNGYRWLGFEVHYTPQLASGTTPDNALFCCVTGPAVYARCFGNGTALERARCTLNGIVDLGRDTGCYPLYDRNFAENLKEVTDWLRDPLNADDIVMIDIQWKLTAAEDNEPAALTIMNQIITRLAGTLVYTPALKGNASWPTVNQLVTQGKRILFVCDAPGCAASPNMFYPRLSLTNVTFDQQTIDGFNTGSCASTKYGPTPLPHNDFLKFWEDRTWRLLVDGFPRPPSRTGMWPATESDSNQGTRFSHYCGINVGLSDASIWNADYVVWSWRTNDPQNAVTTPRTTDCISVVNAYYKWMTEPCANVQPYACQNTTNRRSWSLVLTPGRGDAAPTCPTGTAYSYPKNGWEMSGLFNTIAGSGITANVWINAPATAARPPADPPVFNDFSNLVTSPYLTHPGVPVYVPLNITDSTGAEGPRFCGLQANALNFDCRWDVYGQQVADREVGFLVFAGIGLAVSCIFGVIIALCCCQCIFKRGGRLNRLAKMEDGDLDNGKGRKRDRFRFLLAIPFVLVICGTVPLFIGNIRLTTTWNDAQAYIRDRRDGLSLIKNEVVSTLVNFRDINGTGSNISYLVERLEYGVNDMNGNFDNFLKILDASSVVRNVVTWFITIGMLVLCLFGFIFLWKKAPKALLFLLVLVNFCVFLTIIDFTVHSSMQLAADDICKEIHRPNGMFSLWQRRPLRAFEQMRLAVKVAFDSITIAGCGAIRQACSLPYQVCGNYPCHKGNFFTELGNLSIVDADGTIKTLYSCATQCTDTTLQGNSSKYLQDRQAYTDYNTLEAKILVFLDDLSGEKGQQDLSNIFCGLLTDNLSYVYGGAAVLLIGELAEMAFLFWLGY